MCDSNKNIIGKIFDIQYFSVGDGPGIRTTVFFKGCNMHCAWCHNPESQSPHTEMMFYKNKCVGCGKCKEKCPNNFETCSFCGNCTIFCPIKARAVCGKDYTVSEVWEKIKKDKSFYDNSGGGVTFSGGECMLQIDFLKEILKICKENGIHTTVDTAGYAPYEQFEQIIPYTDLFLYDIKCFDCGTHKKYTGVDNRLIMENLTKLLKSPKNVWVRIPIIPEINDSKEEMIKIRDYLYSCGKPQKIEFLPYHAFGEHKYPAIGREIPKFSVPTNEKIAELKSYF